MKVYLVEEEWGNDCGGGRNVIGIYDHIAKAGWSVWEKLDLYKRRGKISGDLPSLDEIIESNGAKWLKDTGSIGGEFTISEHEVK